MALAKKADFKYLAKLASPSLGTTEGAVRAVQVLHAVAPAPVQVAQVASHALNTAAVES